MTLLRDALVLASVLTLSACGAAAPKAPAGTPSAPVPVRPATRPDSMAGRPVAPVVPVAPQRFQAGNPAGRVPVPAAGRAVDTSHPSRYVGKGTAASCTSRAVVQAVAAGGVIRFRCGPRPVTITMKATARVRNTVRRVVLDGRGLVTLSGAGTRRVLYQNTCEKSLGWATSHCNDQAWPQLTVQNLTFADGNATATPLAENGGGAIFVRGGRFKVVHSRFVRNRCRSAGPDVGGAALRVLDQSRGRPVYVVDSSFTGGVCSNGGALSSIGVSWTVLNSVLTSNRAVGRGANPAKPGSAGGGSGGAIYNDGNRFTLRLGGSVISGNRANEGGGAIFFVSNDRTGTLRIDHSALRANPNAGFHTAGFPGIFFLGAGSPGVATSTIR
ncbi:MAG: hypothetical protein ABIS86_16760 [Streptosporangiaceae bacterium]